MAQRHVPQGCVSISDLPELPVGQLVTTMGVVVDRMEPRKTRNDWQFSFALAATTTTDPNCARVIFFKPEPEDLPSAVKIGDIVALQDIKVNVFNMARSFLASRATEWARYDMSLAHKPFVGLSSPGFKSNVDLDEWAVWLGKQKTPAAKDNKGKLPAPINTVMTQSRKAVQIKEIEANKFFDLTGEVLKIFRTAYGFVDLSITDYTKNKGLRDYQPADPNWRGPYGPVTLKIEVHEPHATWITDHMERGQIIRLRNVRVKFNRDNALLEANLWPDNQTNKILASRVESQDDPAVLALFTRKRSYINLCKQNGWTNHTPFIENLPSKRTHPKAFEDTSEHEHENEHENVPKKKKSSRNKKKAKAAAACAEAPFVPTAVSKSRPKLRIISPAASIPLSTIDDIIENPARSMSVPGTDERVFMPFVNIKHHARLRIIDFYPHDICDFTELKQTDQPDSQRHEWIWNFTLRLAAPDARSDSNATTIDVEVSGAEATALLGIAPASLKQEGFKFRVRDRLDLLWGNLAAAKDELWADSGKNPSTYREPLELWKSGPVIDLVIAECGVRKRGFEDLELDNSGADDGLREEMEEKRRQDASWGWERIWKLMDTVLVQSNNEDNGGDDDDNVEMAEA